MGEENVVWRMVSRYPSIDALCERHEGLVRYFGKTFCRRGSIFMDSWDLQQELRLVMVDVWSRHAGKAIPEVDKIVKTAMNHAVHNLFSRERRTEKQDEAALVTFEMQGELSGEFGDGFSKLFEHYLEKELAADLSAISVLILRELTHPCTELQGAMQRAAVRGGIVPVARYFGMQPWTLRSALVEIRGVFAELFEIPVKNLRLSNLYK